MWVPTNIYKVHKSIFVVMERSYRGSNDLLSLPGSGKRWLQLQTRASRWQSACETSQRTSNTTVYDNDEGHYFMTAKHIAFSHLRTRVQRRAN